MPVWERRDQCRNGRAGILLRHLRQFYGTINFREELHALPGACLQPTVYFLFSNIYHSLYTTTALLRRELQLVEFEFAESKFSKFKFAEFEFVGCCSSVWSTYLL